MPGAAAAAAATKAETQPIPARCRRPRPRARTCASTTTTAPSARRHGLILTSGPPSSHDGARAFARYDGNDGWAVVDGVDVEELQRWFCENQRNFDWSDQNGRGNELCYFLNRADVAAARAVCEHWKEHLGKTQSDRGGNASHWPDVPAPIHAIDAALRRVLVQPAEAAGEGIPLLGEAESGDFHLGYAQLTRMPQPASSDRTQGVRKEWKGRSLGPHMDSPSYGEIAAYIVSWRGSLMTAGTFRIGTAR